MASTQKSPQSDLIPQSDPPSDLPTSLAASDVTSTKAALPSGSSHNEATLAANDAVLAATTKSFGVRKAEVLAAQATGPLKLSVLYFLIFLFCFSFGLDGNLRGTFIGYATNDLGKHSLLSTISVVSSVVGAASQPTYARLSDVFGRVELLGVALLSFVVGTVLQSQAKLVETLAAGTVFYRMGYSGMLVMIKIIVADSSALNWRSVASIIPQAPFIIITWAAGSAASAILAAHPWSYAIGIWAFIVPLAGVPFFSLVIYMRVKAARTDEWRQILQEERDSRLEANAAIRARHVELDNAKTGRTLLYVKLVATRARYRSLELFWLIDVVGILFVICIWGFILVPFTLAGGAKKTWGQAKIIAPLVVGLALIPFFVVWEKNWARHPLFPLRLLKDRGVWSVLLIGLLFNTIWMLPNGYMYPVLVVGMRASVKAAQRITSLNTFVGVLVGPAVGLIITRVRRTKAFIMAGCCLWFVSVGIFYHFRGSNDGIRSQYFLNGVIAGVCVWGAGTGFFSYNIVVSIQSCTNHEYMAVLIAVTFALYNIGSAVGSSISGAIWTQQMYDKIYQKMEQQGVNTTLAAAAYNSPYTFIKKNTWGTPARTAVVLAYAEVQRNLCIAGLALCVPLVMLTFFLRDHKLPSSQSLEEASDLESGEKAAADRERGIVVNTHDHDPIVEFVRGVFGGRRAQGVSQRV